MSQFSLRWLLVAVTVIAIASIAITNANEAWVSILFTITFLLFLTAVVGALFSVGQRRAYWAGVAIFGWGYVFVFHFLHDWSDYFLPVHPAMRTIYPWLSHEVELPPNMSPGTPQSRINGYRNDGSPIYVVRQPPLGIVTNVAHPLVAAAFGLAGGWIACAFYRRR